MFQPRIAETYEPIQIRHAKNVLLDILEDPMNHQMHIKRHATSHCVSWGSDLTNLH